jgi:hypothetical protein
MSSIQRRIIIEEYTNGGYGVHHEGPDGSKDCMGLDGEHELIEYLMGELEVDIYTFEDFVADAKFFKGEKPTSKEAAFMGGRSTGKTTMVTDLIFRRMRYDRAKKVYEGVI